MRYCSLLLTGLFASASVVVTTQVKAQKRPSNDQSMYMKVMTTADIAINNCYVGKRVNECARLHHIQSTLTKWCGRGKKEACYLLIDISSMERSAMMLQSIDSIKF